MGNKMPFGIYEWQLYYSKTLVECDVIKEPLFFFIYNY